MSARLALETSAARLVARLSRAAGRGGGTTLPGKLVWKLDPAALDGLAADLPHGVALVSATNGKTTTTAMASAILSPSRRLAWNHSGANLASGIASTLLTARDAELGLLEVDEFVLPEVIRRTHPRVVALGNLFRDQLDRYGELEHIAERWRAAVAALGAETTLVVNADDPLVASLADDHGPSCGSASTTRRAREPSPARGRLEVLRALRPSRIATTPRTSVTSARTAARPAATHGRHSTSPRARSSPPASKGSRSRSRPRTAARRCGSRVPGLYNVYNALSAASLCLALGLALDEIVAGLERFRAAFGRFERFVVGDRTVLLLLIKNPAGANEALRTLEDGGVQRTLVVALNDRIADGRDVSWIWDVDFEPLLAAGRAARRDRRARCRARPAVHLRRAPARAPRARARASKPRSIAGSR